MLHLYGRFCNASKLAGEVDFFEALDAVKKHYPIDENRIVIRGFSMGGASAWHIGAHFAGLWAAVAPGAGFSESAQFLHLTLTGRERAARVGAAALPPLRHHRLRHQPLQYRDHRLQRRDRRAEAGRRHDGEGDGGRGDAADPRDRPADRAPLPSRFEGRDRPHAGRDRGARARSLAAQGPLHHLDPGLQPHELGDRRRLGQALGTRAPERRDHRRQRGGGGIGQRDRVHAGDGSGRMPAGSGASNRRLRSMGRRCRRRRPCPTAPGSRISAETGRSGRGGRSAATEWQAARAAGTDRRCLPG